MRRPRSIDYWKVRHFAAISKYKTDKQCCQSQIVAKNALLEYAAGVALAAGMACLHFTVCFHLISSSPLVISARFVHL